MSTRVCIFHHPFPIQSGGTSGSRVRPYQMISAFRELGYEVRIISGYARERSLQVARLRQDLTNGQRFDFAYSESHTSPMQLTDPNHLPLRPFVEHRFFHMLKRSNVPVGLFYRDVYWRFDQFKVAYPTPKWQVMTHFYRKEWGLIRKYVDHLFLPSMRMATALPTSWPSSSITPLPPGIITQPPRNNATPAIDKRLRLIYVGGVTPPLYDLTPLIDSVHDLPDVHLTICCRPDEWQKVASHYRSASNVQIVHFSGKQLASLYSTSDLAVIAREPHPYLDFAMPVKVFEALAHGLPLVVLGQSETARFVKQENVGWVVDSIPALRSFLDTLRSNRSALESMYERIPMVQQRHTWAARAQLVANILTPR